MMDARHQGLRVKTGDAEVADATAAPHPGDEPVLEPARRHLDALARVAGVPVALYLEPESGPVQQLEVFVPAPLPALIDSSNPDDAPCRATVLELCREIVATGRPASATCPSGQWIESGWPVLVGEDAEARAVGAVVAGRPVDGGTPPGPLLAARFDLDPDAVATARYAAPDEQQGRRIDAVHTELEAYARELGQQLGGRRQTVREGPRPARVDASGEDLQPLMDAMVLEAVWIVDAAGAVQRANQTCQTWFGFDPVGHGCQALCGTRRAPCSMCSRRTDPAGGSRAAMVRRHQLTLAARSVDVTVYPVGLEGHELPGALVVARDVTSRRRLEEGMQAQAGELARQREQLQEILDCMGEGLLVTDAGGQVGLSNPMTRMLFDATPSDVASRHLLDLLPGNPSLVEGWRTLIEGQADRVQEEVRVAGPRAPKDLLVTVARIREAGGGRSGHGGGYVATLRDITRLKELHRVRDDFVSNVSHELRTPLATVRGFARTLLATPDMDEATRREFIGLIDREAGRLGRLIEDMLSMAHLDAGGALRTQQLDLCAHVEELEVFFGPQLESGGVALRVDVPDAPVWVAADGGLLSQLTHNVVGNALKFTPPEGEVTLTLDRRDRTVTLRVRDTGPGIPEEEQAQIFDKFYRGPSTARAVPGTGLGLAIVKRIVDAHGWMIGLRSRVGEGTEVWVTMELEPTAAPRRAAGG